MRLRKKNPNVKLLRTKTLFVYSFILLLYVLFSQKHCLKIFKNVISMIIGYY